MICSVSANSISNGRFSVCRPMPYFTPGDVGADVCLGLSLNEPAG
jgi:hypothetical protein